MIRIFEKRGIRLFNLKDERERGKRRTFSGYFRIKVKLKTTSDIVTIASEIKLMRWDIVGKP